MILKAGIIFASSYLIIVNFYEVFVEEKSILNKQLETIKNLQNTDSKNKELMDMPFHDRFIKPIIDKVIKSVSTLLPIKESSQEELRKKLLQGGITMSAKDYRAMNLIIVIGFAILGIVITLKPQYTNVQRFLALLIGVFTGYVYRRFSLESKITQRKEAINQQLPEVLDILSVSVVAGLSFYQALNHVVEKSKGPLIEEFKLTQREIMLGRSRSVALENLALRTDVNNVRSFVSAINQADELGISLQNVLTNQSEMMRDSHRQAIEEKAAKIPVKILMPMIVFIFPVIFLVLLGPAVPTIIQSLGGQ